MFKFYFLGDELFWLAPHKNITKTLEAPKTKLEDFILQVSIFNPISSNFHAIDVNVYDWCIFGHEGEQMWSFEWLEWTSATWVSYLKRSSKLVYLKSWGILYKLDIFSN